MDLLKSPLTLRGDHHYCPLPISIDSYSNCEVDCHHCYFRRLNHVWGEEMRPADIDQLEKRLVNGLKRTNPKSPLSHAIKQKKTIRVGNKADPLQPLEHDLRVTLEVMGLLQRLNWSFVIQTRFPSLLLQEPYYRILKASKPGNAIIMPVISPGLDKDWHLLERAKTDRPRTRMEVLRFLTQHGIPGGGFENGVNGEPFIPGFHTIQDFRDTIRLLKEHGIRRYNTYNFHANDFVYKRLVAIDVDIEKVWVLNQDGPWRKILVQLLDIAKEEDVVLGCPDFVNSGWDWVERANTCCGIDVPNPCTFNTHYWKQYIQSATSSIDQILKHTWDNVGNLDVGRTILDGTAKDKYTMTEVIDPRTCSTSVKGFGL